MEDKALIGNHAVLRRITGLKNIKFKSRPSIFGIDKDTHARKDRAVDGDFQDEFKGNVIPGVVTGLAPEWNHFKDSYWVDDIGLLHRLVEKITPRIRYPKGHYMAGQIIDPKDIDPKNYNDPFFQHSDLQTRQMEGGKYMFDFSIPIDEFLFHCYKNHPKVLVRDGREISKYVVGTAKFELIIPKSKTLDEKKSIDTDIEALTSLGGMSYEKQTYIAKVMKLRLSDINKPDPDNLKVQLGRAASDKESATKYGGASPQKRFLELANMKNEDLLMSVDIENGLDLRIITSARGIYYLNEERLENVQKKTDLFTFFKDPANSDRYNDLVFLLKEKEK